jgi:spore maturation protein CgeB
MKVLFAAMQWDYGFKERGPSFELTNLFDAMRRMDGLEVRLFDFMELHQSGGPDLVSRELVRTVDDWKPDLLFAVLFTDEVPQDVLAELRDRPGLTTFNWFCDDHWRFDDFTSVYAPLFNACSTTARSALPKYQVIGYDAVIKTQWACNQHLYRPTVGPLRYDVTFVGQPHGNRRQVIEQLSKRTVPIQTWGQGWEAGRLEQEDMVATFSDSRINLNLSNSSVPSNRWRRFLGRGHQTYGDQIKGRNFEIPSCGGFQLSGASEDLESYFEPDREIVIFHDDDELAAAIERYLADEPARAAIAAAGYRRAIHEHTYAHRFREIFSTLGLS